MIGKTVSHYRIEEKLGQGGMGVVYRAEDTRLGRPVALKALAPEFARDPNRRKRFQQEARAAARLTHPGIAAVYELEEVGDELYIVYEYVRGENLRAVINRGYLSPDTLLDIAADIAAALVAAHTHGVVHRDLKPENIMRTPEGDTKILDFGLARFQPGRLDGETASHLTDAGAIVGTVAYMSPEQLEAKEVDFRTDIFSFGVLLYELATGVRPFEGASPASTIARVLTADPVPLLQRNPVTPPELDRIVRKCLRKSPKERYQSTRDLQVDLDNLRRDSGAGARAGTPAELEEEPSLLRRAFGVFGASPRRWWELQHLSAVFAFFPLYIYLGWSVREKLPGSWGAEFPWGLLFFIGLLLSAAISMTLRAYLLVTGAFNPRGLAAEVRRLAPVLHGATRVFMGILTFMSALLLPSGTALAMWALCLGVAGLLLSAVMEPTLDRAAFPAAVEKVKDLSRRKGGDVPRGFRLLAAIQLLYLLPVAYLLARSSWLVETATQWQQLGLRPSDALGLAAVLAFLLASLLIGGATTLALWRGDATALRAFYRWFFLYVLVDIAGGSYAVAMTIKYINNAALLFVLPVLVYLPLYQRRRARELLASFPEEGVAVQKAPRPELPLSRAESQRLGGILLLQLLYHLPVWYLFIRSDTFFLPAFIFLLATGISGGFGWELCRGKRETAAQFAKFFPLFVLVDLLGTYLYLALGWDVVRMIPPPVALLVAAVVLFARFHQRQLARKLFETPVIPQQWLWGVTAVATLLLTGQLVTSHSPWRQWLPGGTKTPRIESIAVLPLENLSRDPEQEYFADGMTEALISDLAQIRALRVISRTSVMQYKGARKPLPEIARELDVDAVVEGSVQRAGNRVRITAQLIHAPTDKHLWAQSYERDLRDILTLESEVARAIAAEIRIKVTPTEETRLARSRPVDPAAHEAYLKGSYHWNKFTREGFLQSVEYFRRAIEIDPSYAPAYAGLAQAYSTLVVIGGSPPQETFPKAKKAALKALELDETLARAHIALGMLRMVSDWDWTGAKSELKRAMELNPGEARYFYGVYLARMGQSREGLAELTQARKLDPLSLRTNGALAWALFLGRHYDQALEESRSTLEMDPNYPMAHWILGSVYGQKGRLGEAIAELQQAAASDETPLFKTTLAYAFAAAGKESEARKLLAELSRPSEPMYVSPTDLAMIHVGLNEKKQAIALLEQAYQVRDTRLPLIKTLPQFDPLRSDPRFQNLLRRLNLPPE